MYIRTSKVKRAMRARCILNVCIGACVRACLYLAS